MSLKFCLSFILIFVSIESRILPKYISKCSLKNPEEFTKCAVEKGNAAFQKIVHGDKEYKIPDLEPLKISSLELNDSGLKLKILNVTAIGIKNSKVVSVRYDQKTKKFHMFAVLDKLTIRGHYVAEGKILVLPIDGEGEGKLEFLNGNYSYTFDFEPVKKNGKEVIKVQNLILNTQFGGATFELSNLFNGNEQLGKEMNKFLNENWSEVVKEFDVLIVSPIKEVVFNIFSAILNDLTYDEVFSDV